MSDKPKKSKKTKKPIQVYLEEEQLEALRYQAEQNGESLAKMIREGVAMYLAQIPLEDDPALSIIGIADFGVDDLAENHDKYLAEDFEKQHKKYSFEDKK